MTAQDVTVVSAPGKVLIAGGYLVLEPAYPGLVISTTSRFYTVITKKKAKQASSSTTHSSQLRISVQSPQFIDAKWDYLVELQGQDKCLTRQSRESYENSNAGKNPFVALSILYAVRLALEATSADDVRAAITDEHGSYLDVNVLADNDFYSQRSTDGSAPSAEALQEIPPFNAQNCAIRDVHKTGLGSSAAMTTSLVGALLVQLGVVHADPATGGIAGDEALALVHNTAQLAHCAAQGKVGSGFDVSAAVWGSQLYRRFDKEAIQGLLDAGEAVGVEGDDASSSSDQLELAPFLDPRNRSWQPSPLGKGSKGGSNPTAVEGLASASSTGGDSIARPAPLELPPFVEMMLADVDAGSNTPSMVGKILEWRKSNPEWAQQMWTILAAGNQTLADGLLALRLAHAQNSAEYLQAVQLASQHFSKDWDKIVREHPSTTLTLLVEVRNAMRSIQGGMRALGRQAGVPVEPDEMGNVIKATIDGAHAVLGGGVPGAGGYDALFVLYLKVPKAEDTQDNNLPVEKEIEGVWSHWKALSVGPLLSKAGGAAGVISSADQVHSALLQQGAPSSLPVLSSSGNTEAGGLRLHSLDDIKGLRQAIENAASAD
ncbi:ribosomal protein S5 domain 2-like protein [Meira miltonrushii]|uniref:phosphomevalonate kinase n=1 Tax=Meira miltonrushii TaxID=1280837 RepID=A0A316VH47_9BASI|nr:ribosomal protein S5 domain 2-like protein [Meira miltonrushii]PWN36866.1 ribosomal protein S5 domain 2-like protein [Meira miltonrushii]